ncbi:TELO2-interacting protein 2-like isoform X1 [Bacillus rossius redtenbacheri]|uniref:TELO2-interacting protein 2-like isoform X1 n=1 Tax=Bacillus rossius redtenbacheri TaxID=93214 RepID=UPI002FDDC318
MECSEISENSFGEDSLGNLLNSIQITTSSSFVPVKPDGNIRPLEENDFKDFVSRVECNLRELISNLSELIYLLRDVSQHVTVFSNAGNDVVVPLILLCGEHRKPNSWNSENTVNNVNEILQLLCKLCSCKQLSDILLETSTIGGKKFGALLKPCLLSLRPKLLKDTWKTFPAAIACFQWILNEVKAPYLSDYFDIILPTALIIVDDFQTENQLRGILCLQHIVENVTCAELGWHGRGDVVFQALQRVLYEREPALVGPLVSCLALLLDKLERARFSLEKDHAWCRYDDVLEVYLRNMEMEGRPALRRAYLGALPHLLEATGVAVVRWSRRLLRILQEYGEAAGQTERGMAVAVLQALKTYMKLARPRVRDHATIVFSVVLRLLYDATVLPCTDDSHEGESLMKPLEECLAVLAETVPDEARKIAVQLKTQARFNNKFDAVVDSVLAPFCS